MSNEWPFRRLDQVCTFRGGATPSKAVEHFWQGEIPWVSSRDVKVDVVTDTTNHISEEAIESCSVSWIPRDSILMVFRSGVLSWTVPIALAGRDLTINQDLKALMLNESVRPRFLFHLLRSRMDELLTMASQGATVHRLDFDAVRSLRLALPPLREQDRIVAILDEAFEGIETARRNAETNLRNAHALFDSELNRRVMQRGAGWTKFELAELGATQTGTTPPTKNPLNYGDFIPFIKPSHFRPDGALDESKSEGLSETGLSRARRIPAGSVLMVCIGATIGKSGYNRDDVAPNQQINAITPNEGVIAKFLYYTFLSTAFQRSVKARAGQATLPVISKSKWNALPVWMPEAPGDQERIAQALDDVVADVDCLAAAYSGKLEALTALKKSLLHEAFAGNL